MEALLLTAAVVGAMVLALVLLGRTWPRSSRAGGFRAGKGAGRDAPDPGVAGGAREDDDVHWSWPDGHDEESDPRA